jgi:signal transduction histidine kinase
MAIQPEPIRRASTLTRTLLAWLTVPLFVLLIISAYSTYRNATRLAEAERDLALEQLNDELGKAIHSSLGKDGTIPAHSQTIDLILSDPKDQRYYAVYNGRGSLIAGDRRLSLADVRPNDSVRTRFSYVSVDHTPVRLAVLKADADSLPGFHILLAETLNRRSKLALRFSRAALIPQAAILFFAFPLIWLGVRKGLSRLERLRHSITSRSAQNLDPISGNDTPGELRPMVMALNGLLARVKAAQDEQRRFTANAAHQIKTPLAVLTAEIDLAMSDASCPCAQATYRRLHEALSRLAHLVRQLLALERSEADAGKTHRLFDLTSVARAVTADYVAAAANRHIDLGYEGSEQPVPIRGSELLVREAMKNLLENALKFTPEGGTITASVQDSPRAFAVADSGPGVPEAEWPLVFQRFHRASEVGSTEGSGLGLAIVQEVARSHGATITVARSLLGGALFEFKFLDPIVGQS